MYCWSQFKSIFLFLSNYVRETNRIILCDVLLLGLTFNYSLILEVKLDRVWAWIITVLPPKYSSTRLKKTIRAVKTEPSEPFF